LKIKNFTGNDTNEEEFIKAALNALVATHPDGLDIDLAPLLELAPCFGFSKDSFEASIESDHIVLSFDRAAQVKECDIIYNMAVNTN